MAFENRTVGRRASQMSGLRGPRSATHPCVRRGPLGCACFCWKSVGE